MTEQGHETAAPPPKPWPVAAQGLGLLALAGALALPLVLLPALLGRAAPAAQGDGGDAGFVLTEQQWAGLRLQRLAPAPFAPARPIDARIALDDDLSTPVFSPFSGRVTRVIAKAGDAVGQGAPLFAVLSPELAQAQADLITALGADSAARAQLALTTANEARQHTLFLNHGAAQRDWQQAQADLATARGAAQTAAIGLGAARGKLAALGVARADIAALEALPDKAHASAEILVRAPFAGTVTQRQINPGQMIVGSAASAGAAAAVYTIADLHRLWLVGAAAEDDAAILRPGDAVSLRVAAYPGRVLTARLDFVAPVIDPATHRLAVRATLDNADLALKPDMLAIAELQTARPAPALSVPARAVVYDGADAHVFVADLAHKTLAIRPVTLGQAARDQIEVISGLRAGETIVASGAVFIDRALTGGDGG